MKKKLILMTALTLVMLSCKKPGCIDPQANNFNSEAKTDDGTCTYPPEDHRLPVLGYYLMKDSVFVDGAFSQERTYSIRLRLESGDTELTDKVIMEGLFGTGHVYYGNVDKYFDVEFPSQPTAPSSGVSFTGDGYIYGHYLSYNTYHSYVDGETTYHVHTKALGDK